MVNIVILLFIYGVQKLSAFFSLSVLKGFLADLQDSYLENTMHMERKKKKMRWVFAGLVLVLLFAVIFGLLRAKGIL